MRAILLTIIFLLPIVRPQAQQAQPIGLAVNVTKTLGAINPFVYGANHGPWAFVPLDLMPMAEQSGVTYLRFPAGNWGDDNDLQPYHVDPFIAFARKLNAEPSISVRLKNGSVQKAADLVRYVNIEKGYKVRYWSIGNEPDLFPNYSIEQYNRDWRTFAEAILKVDPTILFVGPDVSQFPPTVEGDPYNNIRREWVRSFLKANGDLVSIVSIHRYPFPKIKDGNATKINDLRENTHEWGTLIDNLRAVVKDATNRDLPIALTEVNSHWTAPVKGEGTPDSLYNAVWWADVLGQMIRARLDIVAFFTLQTSSDSFGLLARYDARPTYYVYQLYKQFGDTLVQATSADPDVSITAATKPDGTLTLMIVNLAAESRTAMLQTIGFTTTQSAAVWRLDADHKAERVGSQSTQDALTLPPQSVSLYTFSH